MFNNKTVDYEFTNAVRYLTKISCRIRIRHEANKLKWLTNTMKCSTVRRYSCRSTLSLRPLRFHSICVYTSLRQTNGFTCVLYMHKRKTGNAISYDPTHVRLRLCALNASVCVCFCCYGPHIVCSEWEVAKGGPIVQQSKLHIYFVDRNRDETSRSVRCVKHTYKHTAQERWTWIIIYISCMVWCHHYCCCCCGRWWRWWRLYFCLYIIFISGTTNEWLLVDFGVYSV